MDEEDPIVISSTSSGAFGTVYKYTSSSSPSTKLATKVCDLFQQIVGEEKGTKTFIAENLRELCFYSKISKHDLIKKYSTLLQSNSIELVNNKVFITMPDAGMPLFQNKVVTSLPSENQFMIAHKIWLQFCEALIPLHDNKISHGDIKLENVLLTTKNRNLHLIDFGGIHFPAKVEKDKFLNFSTTPNYNAPECRFLKIADQEFDSRPNDIWSMGIVMFEYLCGKIHDNILPMVHYYDDQDKWSSFVSKSVNDACVARKLDFKSTSLFQCIISMLQIDPNKRPCVRHLYQSINQTNTEYPIQFSGIFSSCYDSSIVQEKCVSKYIEIKNSKHDGAADNIKKIKKINKVCKIIVHSLFYDFDFKTPSTRRPFYLTDKEQLLACDIIQTLDFDLLLE